MDLPEEYILFTGTRDGYKNFQFFIISIADLLRKSKNLFLVCTGAGFSKDEAALFIRLGIGEKVLHRFASEKEILHLYKAAICFVFPSYYEGFGLPILEAFESGCPVLLARASCFPEIAGDAALYFDPKNKQELVDTIWEILNNITLRNELAKKGFDRVSMFSWDNTFQKTIECYAELGG
jgi:glycosyltransferase involved in cell wall biosynthesis